jgi:type IV secretory pathway VirB2 component (pilin)
MFRWQFLFCGLLMGLVTAGLIYTPGRNQPWNTVLTIIALVVMILGGAFLTDRIARWAGGEKREKDK